jgi:hypothetical protein
MYTEGGHGHVLTSLEQTVSETAQSPGHSLAKGKSLSDGLMWETSLRCDFHRERERKPFYGLFVFVEFLY